MNPIKPLLSQNFLLSKNLKEKILLQWDDLEEPEQEKILQILDQAQGKQNEFLAIAVENNPNLLDELQGIIREGEREQRKNKEFLDRKEEENILGELEKMLEGEKFS